MSTTRPVWRAKGKFAPRGRAREEADVLGQVGKKDYSYAGIEEHKAQQNVGNRRARSGRAYAGLGAVGTGYGLAFGGAGAAREAQYTYGTLSEAKRMSGAKSFAERGKYGHVRYVSNTVGNRLKAAGRAGLNHPGGKLTAAGVGLMAYGTGKKAMGQAKADYHGREISRLRKERAGVSKIHNPFDGQTYELAKRDRDTKAGAARGLKVGTGLGVAAAGAKYGIARRLVRSEVGQNMGMRMAGRKQLGRMAAWEIGGGGAMGAGIGAAVGRKRADVAKAVTVVDASLGEARDIRRVATPGLTGGGHALALKHFRGKNTKPRRTTSWHTSVSASRRKTISLKAVRGK